MEPYPEYVYTDYPFEELGDIPNKEAPVRRVQLHSYDGNKYCKVGVDGCEYPQEVKAEYLYKKCSKNGQMYIQLQLSDLYLVPTTEGCYTWKMDKQTWLDKALCYRPSTHTNSWYYGYHSFEYWMLPVENWKRTRRLFRLSNRKL